MNKYAESYQRLTNRIYKYDHIEDVYKDLEVLGELVDKATPKKAIIASVQDVRYVTKYTCPSCGSSFIGKVSKHCHHCGQALSYEERSEDEE